MNTFPKATASVALTPQARQAIAVGRIHHWRFWVVGQGEIPTQPVYIPGVTSGWWFERIATAPVIASERLLALKASGIKVQGLLLAHEAPKILISPDPAPSAEDEIKAILTDLGKAAAGLALGLAFLVSLVGISIVALSALFVPLLLIDPAVIAVLPDGTWLLVCAWYD